MAASLNAETVDELLYGDQAKDETAEAAYAEFVANWKSKNDVDPDSSDDVVSFDDSCKFWDGYQCAEPRHSGTYEHVKYASTWIGGALAFWILDSTHITYRARLASPCVPNAAILDTLDGSVKGYNVPDSWRT